jgi:copper chaperone CopZ
MREHLFKWCKRLKREQKRLWVDGQEGEDGYNGVEKVLKKPKISQPMCLVVAEEKCSPALRDVSYRTDVGRISGVVEEADSAHERSSDRGV